MSASVRAATHAALADRDVSIVSALPGPIATRMIAEAKTNMSPSLIHVYPLMVARAAGCMVEDVDGNVFLDAQAGVSAASTGHSHPQVSAAMAAQSDNLIHICGTDFFYPNYGALCTKLAELAARLERSAGVAPTRPWQVFLTNSGTEGVEASIKLARFHTKRPHLIAFRGGFHGRTMGSLSLTASKSKYRKHFGPLLAGVHHAEYGNLASIERDLFARTVNPEEVAAIVVEPVLGEGGYIVPSQAFITGLRKLCDQHGILLVFDEVQSGMGRTGKMFAAEHFGVVPDIFVLAKGLASGMPLGAMMARSSVMTWPPGSHGSTCGGNPVAIAAALATISLLEGELLANTVSVGALLKRRLEETLAGMPGVLEVRGLGLMLGIELATPKMADDVALGCYQRGLLVLECGDKAIRISPPLIMNAAQAETTARLFTEACRAAA
ncbi:MAG TPA: aminotransferase class III-fold pyridoxal phosphate-dependent enzyme [Polyangia bacterium]